MQSIQFHLDESVPNAIAAGLKSRGIDVTTTAECGLNTASDQDQLAFALSQNRVLVTRDADFLAFDRRGLPHAGIVFWSPARRDLGRAVLSLALLWRTTAPGEMAGRVEYL
jgi:hypothetical protein